MNRNRPLTASSLRSSDSAVATAFGVAQASPLNRSRPLTASSIRSSTFTTFTAPATSRSIRSTASGAITARSLQLHSAFEEQVLPKPADRVATKTTRWDSGDTTSV